MRVSRAGGCGCAAAATMLQSGGSVGAGFIPPLLLCVAGLVVFARRQLRVSEPFLRLQCFRDKTFVVSALIVVCAHMMFMAPSIMVSLFVQDIQGLSATVSGLTLLFGAIMMGVMSSIIGRLLDRRGSRLLIAAGCVTVLAGTVAFALIPASVPEWVVTVLYGVRAGHVRLAEDGKRCEIAGPSCHCGEEGWSEGISLLAPF